MDGSLLAPYFEGTRERAAFFFTWLGTAMRKELCSLLIHITGAFLFSILWLGANIREAPHFPCVFICISVGKGVCL